MQIIEIKTRYASNTHFARAVSHKLQASSTAGIDQAVDALKQKYWPRAVVERLQPNSLRNSQRLAQSITHLLVIK